MIHRKKTHTKNTHTCFTQSSPHSLWQCDFSCSLNPFSSASFVCVPVFIFFSFIFFIYFFKALFCLAVADSSSVTVLRIGSFLVVSFGGVFLMPSTLIRFILL